MREIGFGIRPIETKELILGHLFTRATLSKECGGNTQDTFPKVNSTFTAQHGYTRFMCPSLDYNPLAPQIPGAPGLYFALRDKKRWPEPNEIVITRYAANEWNVMGNYEMKQSAPLTGEEFQRLPEIVRKTWVKNVTSNFNGWGAFTLAAIHLRRERGCEPSITDIQRQVDKGKSHREFLQNKVSSAAIQEAFRSGEEKINVWTMKCVGYDERFKRKLLPVNLLREAGVKEEEEEADHHASNSENLGLHTAAGRKRETPSEDVIASRKRPRRSKAIIPTFIELSDSDVQDGEGGGSDDSDEYKPKSRRKHGM
ncbi:hypothetical protein DFH11DRAFT_1305052 [Phellopilus nigrolimitatus]|nr:hypothetical protein DFH11DRAFT_1305052 [Phellopilus nigrolimitatus]